MTSFFRRVVGLFRKQAFTLDPFFDDGYVVVWVSGLRQDIYGHRFDSIMCHDRCWRCSLENVETIKRYAVVFKTLAEAEKAASDATIRLRIDEDGEMCVAEKAKVAIDMITTAQSILKIYNETLTRP